MAVRSEYFCDRCQKNVTAHGAQFALHEATIKIPGANPIVLGLCADCARATARFALEWESGVATSAGVTRD